MRLQHLHVAYLENKKAASSSSSALSPSQTPSTFPFAFQCLRPLAPKISLPEPRTKGPEFGRVRTAASKLLACTVQVAAGGTTRWNPSTEQIKVLEALYRGGMRTPNAAQIERITEELGRHGRIEGKNVFYWFQNHKARERQKQKRAALLTLATAGTGLDDSSDSPPLPPETTTTTKDGAEKMEAAVCADVDVTTSCKRRCKAWGDGGHGGAAETEGGGAADDVTLELFPLRPQGKA